MRAAAIKNASRRIAILRAVLLCGLLILAGRAAHLTVLGDQSRQCGDCQVNTHVELPATRGLIVDRNGVELALTIHAPSVYVMPRGLEADPEALQSLSQALGVRTRALRQRLEGRDRFTFIARWVSDEVARKVEALNLPGVGILREPRRAYPAGELAASILGFSNIDGEGVRGIEQQEDPWLKGSRVRTPVQRDARGRLLSHTVITPRDATGGDVALTIDASMQAEAEIALREAIERCGAIGGTVITMDPKTGEILALAEAPGFNPNEFRSISYPDTRSRAFADAVEPGSTFKAFLVAAALEAGAISINTTIDTGEGSIDVPGKRIYDHHPYGVLDTTGVLRVSSNVGAVLIAQQLGPEAYFDSLRRFGFGVPTGSGFPTESAGLLRPWQSWKPVDHATVAFGQGVSVTAVQLASAMSVLAGNGEWKRPRLVSARRRPTGRWQRVTEEARHRVVSESTARTVLGMLEHVVSATGTARRAALADVPVAGKTGTAQKFDTELGSYSKTRYRAWFMGAAPADDPRLVVVAIIDEPKGPAHGGGDVAAPLFARVAAEQLAHLGIITRPEPIRAAPREPVVIAEKKRESKTRRARKPKPEPVAAVSAPPPEPAAAPIAVDEGASSVAAAPTTAAPRPPRPEPTVTAEVGAEPASHGADQPVLMPDFRGETVESARRLAARDSLSIEVRGNGLAVSQDPSPGTVVVGNQRHVRVVFSFESREG